jgi:hypothetical protein
VANIYLKLFNYLQALIELDEDKNFFTQCAKNKCTIPIAPALLR